MPLAEDRSDIPDEQARWMRGEEDPLRVISAGAIDWGHPLQYAVTGHPHSVTVVGTGNATDEQIRKLIEQTYGMPLPAMPIERFNRCPTCEQWSPCSVRKAWSGKLPADEPSVEVTAQPDGFEVTDVLATARNAVDSIALDLERTGHHSVERLGVLAQSAALASIAESLAALLVPPGVVGGTQKFIQAATEALTAQTEAIRAVGARLEAIAFPLRPVYRDWDVETGDLDALVDSQRARWMTVPEPLRAGAVLADADSGIRHTADRLRMQVDRIRELAEQRQALSHGGQFDSDAVVQPSELLAILDGDPAPATRAWVDDLSPEIRAKLGWGVQFELPPAEHGDPADLRLRTRVMISEKMARGELPEMRERWPGARLVAALPGDEWREVPDA